MIIVVMGVSGSGKSTVGQALAQSLDWDFQEGDDLHPQANVEKMRAGIALADTDRTPWLERVAAWMDDQQRRQRGGVVSCSALKRRYRERLCQADADVCFIYLQLSRAALESRLQQREHFMPASLLDSQLQALEPPAADEPALTIDGQLAPEAAVRMVKGWLAGRH